MNVEENPEVEKEFTNEELEKMREDTIAYYKDKISVLSVQAEHEELLARIAEAQLKQVAAIIRRAQLTAPPEEEINDLKEKESVSKQEFTQETQEKRSLKKN
jgi:ABC-type taurine transport system substrate-binding protein